MLDLYNYINSKYTIECKDNFFILLSNGIELFKTEYVDNIYLFLFFKFLDERISVYDKVYSDESYTYIKEIREFKLKARRSAYGFQHFLFYCTYLKFIKKVIDAYWKYPRYLLKYKLEDSDGFLINPEIEYTQANIVDLDYLLESQDYIYKKKEDKIGVFISNV